MMTDQIRSLASLDNVTSSSRVLNLNLIYKNNRLSSEYRQKPLFSNVQLNRAIILKHRLRPSERAEFTDGRSVATKILFPLDKMEIKLGAQYLFVGQNDFEERLCEILREKLFDLGGDIAILQLLDSLPSLDSYLLRQFLERGGLRPSDCYLEKGAADLKYVQQFVLNEMSKLAKLSFGENEGARKTPILIANLLSSRAAEFTDDLRQTLQMQKSDYREGLFFWKAILFYKFQIQKTFSIAKKTSNEIKRIRPVGLISKGQKTEISQLNNKILHRISSILNDASSIISIYDDAYLDLVNNGNVLNFRDFLMSAPQLFKQLGESYNDVTHIVNFWKFRPKKGHSVAVTLETLASMLAELDSMTCFETIDRKRA